MTKAKYRGIVRVLAINPETKKDAEGRGVGDDWLLADMGEGHDGLHYYVTTDRIHASEVGGMTLLQSKELSEYLVEKVNGEWFKYLRKRDKALQKTQEKRGAE